MANTYSQIYIQVVFAVEARQYVIPPAHKEELHKFITGVVTNRGQKLLAVQCMPDHTHLLIGLKPAMPLSDLVGDVKSASSAFIKRKGWVPGRFAWQEGFGAFSYGHSQLTSIIRYIQNQPAHHNRRSFQEEYIQFLKKFGIHYEDRFVFHDV